MDFPGIWACSQKLTEISYVHFMCPLSREYTLSCRISDFSHLLFIRWGHCLIYSRDIGHMTLFPQGKGGGFWYLGDVQAPQISLSIAAVAPLIPCWECEAPVLLFTKLYHSVDFLPHRAFLKTNEIMSFVQYESVPLQFNERCYVLWPSSPFSWI